MGLAQKSASSSSRAQYRKRTSTASRAQAQRLTRLPKRTRRAVSCKGHMLIASALLVYLIRELGMSGAD